MAEEAQNVMLAEKWEENDDPTGYYISEKLDGIRAYWSGSTFYSRNGNVLNAPKWFKQGFPKMSLDGELWCGHNQFRKAVSIVRKKEPTDEWKYVKYYVFDAPGVQGPFEKRMKFVQENIKKDLTPYAVPVGMKVCKGKDHMLGELKLVEKAGGEGLMLRQPKSPYVFGRTKVLLKVKNFFDEEAIVVRHEKGSGRLASTMGHLVVKTPDGREFSVGSGFTDKERNRPPKIGSVITYRYQEMTSKSNKPRFPVYIGTRIDLNWDDYCKSYQAPTLKPPPDLKLDNSILYSKEHGLEQYASFTDAAPPSSSSSSSSSSSAPAPAPAASSSSSSSKPEEESPVQFSSAAADPPSKKRPAAREEAEESTGSTDDRIPCKYGASCYQKSKEHLDKFSHPPKSPVKKPKLEAAAASAAPAAAASSSTGNPDPPAPVVVPAVPAPAPQGHAFTAPGAPASSSSPGASATAVDAARRRTLHYTSGPKQPQQAQPKFEEPKEEDDDEEEQKQKEAAKEEEEEVCPYGDQCYRKNRLHFMEIAHPATHPFIAGKNIRGVLIAGAKKAQKAAPAQEEEAKARPKRVESQPAPAPEKEKEQEQEAAPPREGKGKEKEREEEEFALELTDTIVQPEKLNTSMAELESSSEDESITWDANDQAGGPGPTSESEGEKGKDPFESDLDQTVIIERKPAPKAIPQMEENDQTFILPPRKKTPEDLNQTIVMTQKMSSQPSVAIHLIPASKANDDSLPLDVLARFRLEEGKTMLGRGFGNLEIHDARVSRCHLEALISSSSSSGPRLSLILRGLNKSAVRGKGKQEFVPMVLGEKVDVQDGDEIAFLPDLSHRFVVRIL